MQTLEQLFLKELSDMHDAEKRIVNALPRLAKAASNKELKSALLNHQRESEGHVSRLEEVFTCFDLKPAGQTCEATVALLEEADEMIAEFKDSPVINAALISAAQKIEHHEIASYGCLLAWASLLGNDEAARLLEEILDEESAANDALTRLAVDVCNREALGEHAALPG